MVTTLQPRKPYAKPWQIVLMVIGFIVMTPIYVITVMLLVSFNITGPIADNIDRAKFERVDTFSRGIYDQLVAKSGGTEKWEYSKNCIDSAAGFIGYGTYACEATIITKVKATSVQVLNDLNKKYFGVIDALPSLKLKDSTVFHQSNFGIKFEVSSKINRYILKNENDILCDYDIALKQKEYDIFKSDYEQPIVGNEGLVTIQISCHGKAVGYWYK
jgi:hypothetical protein